MLKEKNILLGVSGGIAAYKAAIIIRLLIKEGANVRVVMTPLAREFITPLTLATLSKNPILVDFFDPEDGRWNSHVDIGVWADAFIIAPATANTMAKMKNGIADNLLLTTYLSARCPVFVAPAMDLDMFKHKATQENIACLKDRDTIIIDPGTGELASGLEGKGRMAEPEEIVDTIKQYFSKKKTSLLKGKSLLINAGPTYENIDPVRFIGNYSSGKMGISLARSAISRGADVTLILGPVNTDFDLSGIKVENVVSAKQMSRQTEKYFSKSDIIILAAAVADFTPEKSSDVKIKSKGRESMNLRLKPTEDIAALLGSKKNDNQILLGFALETNDEQENAIEKLKRKNLDLIVLNSLNDDAAGFGYDTNRISIIDKYNNIDKFELKSKDKVAEDILDKVESML